MKEKRSVHEVLTELRKAKGLRQTEVAYYLREKGIDASQRSVSNWECGRTQPNADAFIKLCELYDVRDVLSAFCGRAGMMSGLNQQGRKRVEEYVRLLNSDPEFSAKKHIYELRTRWLPLYDLPVSAGTGQFLDSSDYELIEVDDSAPADATFAARVAGDSMMPRFADRQIIFVRQQPTLKNGEIGVFLLNGNAYLKKLRSGDKTELISLNPAYDPIPVTEYDDLRIIGRVVG